METMEFLMWRMKQVDAIFWLNIWWNGQMLRYFTQNVSKG